VRVLVTGGLGVIGSWAVRELAGRGHDVLIVENRVDRSLLPDLDAIGTRICEADVTDSAAVRALMADERPEVVVHTAAVIGGNDDPVGAVGVNVGGTVGVLDAAASTGVRRVVYTSARAVYGDLTGPHGHPDYLPVTEDHPRRPVALYDLTKSACEDLVRWYSANRGLETVALRFATIFGPGKSLRHGGFSAYGTLIELPAAGRPARLERGGDERDDVLYVADAAGAIADVVSVPGPLPHDVYNIGTGHTVSMHDIAAAVRTVLPAADIEIGPGRNPMGMPVSYYGALDSSRALADFGWKARFTLGAAVDHYLDSLRTLGLAAADVSVDTEKENTG
jgi:UDP-glucose 4-epimerase